MIKILNYKNGINKKKLGIFLNKRRSGNNKETKISKSILRDIKLNGAKAVLKYEKKYSKNSELKPNIKKN